MLDCIVDFLDQWQTLITGFLALVSAIPTIYFLRKQITQSDTHERERRQAAQDAARAVLPLTLSLIIEYAEESSRILHSVYNQREDQSIPYEARKIHFPKIPEVAVSSLQSFIAAPRGGMGNHKLREKLELEVKQRINKMIVRIQIQNSRLRKLDSREVVLTLNIEEYVLDTAKIYAMTSSLFDYARYKSDKPNEINWGRVSEALRHLNWPQDSFPSLYKTLENRKQKLDLFE